jgi:hypothetical protein
MQSEVANLLDINLKSKPQKCKHVALPIKIQSKSKVTKVGNLQYQVKIQAT